MDDAITDWDQLFLSAALEPDTWLPALMQLADATGSSRAQLIGVGMAREVPFNIVNDFPEKAFSQFVELGGGSPLVNFRVAAGMGMPELAIVGESHYAAARLSLRPSDYLDFCEEQDIWHGCQTNLLADASGLVGLALLRRQSEGSAREEDHALFREAALAARRAVRLQERIEGQQAAIIAGSFETVDRAAFVLDRRGQVQAMSTQAEALLRSGALSLIQRYLEAETSPLPLALAIAALVREEENRTMRVQITRAPGLPPLFLEGYRMPQRPWSLGFQPAAILIARSLRQEEPDMAVFLRTLYGLSPAETDIALRLLRGEERSAISDARKVTTETLRGQIKAVYAKTGVDNEAGLVRLLAGIMG